MARLVRRKWGIYLTLLDRKYFKVKLLWFRARCPLKQQRHAHRSELWLFLKGHGVFSSQSEAYPIASGNAVHIPCGQWHDYLAKRATLVLEIQWGEQCLETDIVRA